MPRPCNLVRRTNGTPESRLSVERVWGGNRATSRRLMLEPGERSCTTQPSATKPAALYGIRSETVIACHFLYRALPVVFTLYLTWSPWHYSGQNYGILLMFARRAGAQPSTLQRRALYTAFLLSYMVAAPIFGAFKPYWGMRAFQRHRFTRMSPLSG